MYQRRCVVKRKSGNWCCSYAVPLVGRSELTALFTGTVRGKGGAVCSSERDRLRQRAGESQAARPVGRVPGHLPARRRLASLLADRGERFLL